MTILKRALRVYVNGDVLNDTPNCSSLMYAMDFGEHEETQIAGCDAALASLKVAVVHARKGQVRQIHEHRPWLHWDKRAEFFNLARQLNQIVAVVIVSAQYAFHIVDPNHLFAHGIKLFADNRPSLWGMLQSRVHETWARAITSSRGRSIRYTTSSCFDTFPLTSKLVENDVLDLVSQEYNMRRGLFLQRRGIGTTEFYKDFFHNPVKSTEDLEHLRSLQHNLDVATLRAFGQSEFLALAERAAPQFLTEDNEPDPRYQGRLFWPAPFRDEVLAHLLDLNARVAADERALGLLPQQLDSAADDQDEAA